MRKTIIKLGMATGLMLMASAVVPAIESNSPMLQLLSVQQVEASSATKYSTTTNLNLRTSASLKGKVQVTIPKGKQVAYLSKSGSWFKVKYGKKTGWVSSKYIKKTSVNTSASKVVVPVSSSVKTTFTTTANLNLRTGTSTKTKILTLIPKGKAVTYVSTSGSWMKVKYGSKTGYVSSKYIKKTMVKVTSPKPVTPKPVAPVAPKPATPAPAPATPIAKPTTSVSQGKLYATTDTLNMRSGGSTSYRVIASIPKGKEVLFTGTKASTGWYRVVYAGKTGFVSPAYLKAIIQIERKTTAYDISLNEMVALQFKLNGQTDAYKSQSAYVRKTAVEKANPTDKTGKVIENSAVVNGSTKHTFGTLKKDDKVSILGETTNYYKINFQTWRNALAGDIVPNVDPTRFARGTTAYYQFLDLSATANVSATEMNKVVSGKGILHNKGKAFIDAGKMHGVNEVYLVSHALLETGHGASQLANGIVVSEVDGEKVSPKKVYNMFGIGAYDETALKSGSERAYKEGWTTPEKAIIGGAKFIGEMYVNHPVYKQNTLYKMRWNPATPGVHQYATDIGWAVKQTKSIDALYKSLSDYSLTFDVPVYKK